MAKFEDYLPPEGEITMFSTEWCGYCKRLKMMLASTDIKINEINIEETAGTEELVKSVNDGNAVVPTVLFADGRTATNPSLPEVQKFVAAAH
ncbi:glutaredoxin domain-containing protein [Canibacter zhoujuaniae]|uniref:glutaredoxin domain-containing protein n=1 Tax=Canibacter zhoujuaniae TaxID=2708343 RepID=UPI00141FDA7E|nr:glutaredoxin domain-containing protein [Canibacter zhoujuaniae]